MNAVFYWCVDVLRFWAAKMNMTYEELNVWLFVIIMPGIIFLQTLLLFRNHLKNRKSRR